MIPTTITSSGAVMLTDEVRAYVDVKVARIARHMSQDPVARMVIELSTTGGARTGEEYRAEMNLTMTGGMLRAESSQETLHAAIDICADELQREVRRKITKHRDLVRRGAARVKELFRYFRG